MKVENVCIYLICIVSLVDVVVIFCIINGILNVIIVSIFIEKVNWFIIF